MTQKSTRSIDSELAQKASSGGSHKDKVYLGGENKGKGLIVKYFYWNDLHLLPRKFLSALQLYEKLSKTS